MLEANPLLLIALVLAFVIALGLKVTVIGGLVLGGATILGAGEPAVAGKWVGPPAASFPDPWPSHTRGSSTPREVLALSRLIRRDLSSLEIVIGHSTVVVRSADGVSTSYGHRGTILRRTLEGGLGVRFCAAVEDREIRLEAKTDEDAELVEHYSLSPDSALLRLEGRLRAPSVEVDHEWTVQFSRPSVRMS